MSVREFAVIGHPIGHTMSPFIHKRLFELSGEKGQYGIIDISPEELGAKMTLLNELAGYNITIPHKQAIIPLIDELDSKARLYGSVNTVSNGSVRKGYTTDPDGFVKALEGRGIPLEGRVMILGSGGAARTFVYEAAKKGCDITIVVRSPEKAQKGELACEVRKNIPTALVRTCLLSEIGNESYPDLLVNGTPVGMYPHTDAMPVTEKFLSGCRRVFDAVYNPLETKLIRAAKANGAEALGGMSMLVWQAAAAHEIWDGSSYSIDEIDQLIEDSASELKKHF